MNKYEIMWTTGKVTTVEADTYSMLDASGTVKKIVKFYMYQINGGATRMLVNIEQIRYIKPITADGE